jgi:hypothetical protein
LSGHKGGETTVTAASEDGSVKVTCKVSVIGFGAVQGYSEETGKGICNKPTDRPQAISDNNAVIVVISKNLAAGTDMKGAVEFNFGEKNDEGYYFANMTVTMLQKQMIIVTLKSLIFPKVIT